MFKENEKLHNQAQARLRRQKEARPVSAARLADTCQRNSALLVGLICSRDGPNLRSGVPIFFIRGGKVRLIHLLDYLSVASAESGLFSDWSRNKRSVSLACY